MGSFRELERKFLIINNPKYAKLTGTTHEANSVLCYGYVDNSAGLTYQVVAPTLYIGGDYTVVDSITVISLKIRAGSISPEEIIPVKNQSLFRQFSHIVENINEFYYTDTERKKCRCVEELDQFRHPEFPDDVQVMFSKNGFRPEGIWVRTQRVLGKEGKFIILSGCMLNTPHANFGLKSGDTVTFATGIVDDSGTRLCFALLK